MTSNQTKIEIHLVGQTGLFFANWYVSKYQLPKGFDGIEHFCSVGWRAGKRPNPYFDPTWYLAQYPDVTSADLNPLLHYVAFGEPEGRDPSPYFFAQWYRKTYELGAKEMCLRHFLERRFSGQVNPVPIFDAAWYLRNNLEVAQGEIDPFEHFLLFGAAAGCNPSAKFDVKFYSDRYGHLLGQQNPLLHYLSNRENREFFMSRDHEEEQRADIARYAPQLDKSVPIATFEKMHEVKAYTQYVCYPNVYQRSLIPDNALEILTPIWTTDHVELPNLTFFRARHVYVLDEGLVFTKDGAFVKETGINFSDTEINHASTVLLKALMGPKPIPLHPRSVLCIKRGAKNYGHWLIEILPKAYWVHHKLMEVDWSVAVKKNDSSMQSIVRESLATLGIRRDQIIELDGNPAYFEELLIVQGLSSHSIFISQLVLECIDFIAAKAKLGKTERLYAGRRPAISRNFENESELIEVFEKHGYTEIHSGEISFMDQVSTFKSAKRVTGVMGAALANIIFCRPGTEVLLFMPASALETFYWQIAELRKLDYHEIRTEETGAVFGNLPWDRSLRLSSTALEKTFLYLERRRLIPSQLSVPPQRYAEFGAAFICTGKWSLIFQNQKEVRHIIVFEPNGSIRGYKRWNKFTWRISEGAIEILNRLGMISWRFDDIQEVNERLRFRARCLAAGSDGLLAYLHEIQSIGVSS